MKLIQDENQWLWMMGWCRDRRIPPANATNWDNALSAYVEKLVCTGQKVSTVLPVSGLVRGFILRVDNTCYQPTHKANDPMVNIAWDDNRSSFAVWSVHLADGVKINQCLN